MSIPKPKTIGELYLFFIKGLPREPANIALYNTVIRRRGWNILTDYDRGCWILPVTYYSNWKQDNPEWSLNIRKYK